MGDSRIGAQAAVERAIAETLKAVSERLGWLEGEKTRMPELVKQAEAIFSKSDLRAVEAEGVPPSQQLAWWPKKKNIIAILRRNLDEDAAKGADAQHIDIAQQIQNYYGRLTPAWWVKVEQLIAILRRNLVEDAAQTVENEITLQIEDFYWRFTPKAVDEAERYRELIDAEEELAKWLLDYLGERWLLSYIRANLIAQKPSAAKLSDAAGGGGTRKKSTCPGEAEEKWIGMLTAHHQWEHDGTNGRCGNKEPIGSNELAEKAKIGQSSSSRKFTKYFGGYEQYCADCRRFPSRIADTLTDLNNGQRPSQLRNSIECDIAAPEPSEEGDSADSWAD